MQIEVNCSTRLSNIRSKLLNKIRYSEKLPDNQKLISAWGYRNNIPNAGQIQIVEELPNKNIKVRDIVIYSNQPNISYYTRIFSPTNELLKGYFGKRGASAKLVSEDKTVLKSYPATIEYANDTLSASILSKLEEQTNPNIKYNNL